MPTQVCSLILKLSSFSSTSWFRMYSIIISSVTFPELATKYPLPQKCRPQNCFAIVLNSLIIFQLLFPFNSFTNWLTDRWVTDTNKWMWSLETCPCNYLYIIALTNLPYQFPNSLRQFSCQHRLSILRYPYNMIFDVLDTMRRLSVVLHSTKIVKLKSPPKGGGFSPIPRRGH